MLATGEVKCIDEEIPFEIPHRWEWERFGNIMINKDSERVPLSVAQRQQLKKTYDYYGASGVIDKVDKYLFDKDLLLIGEDGANLINRSTPIAFIAKGKYWVNNHAHVLDVCCGMALSYVALFINAISLVDYITGTAQPKMNQEKMNSILLAIPPVKEQHRILEKMSMVDAFVDKYASLQTKLDSLDNSVYELLRKSILQEAIQGKLVPQLTEEGTAQELLEQIKAEKQKLVKEGKLKKSALSDSVIFHGDDNKYYEKVGKKTVCIEDEVPFKIPEKWGWCRLRQICNMQAGKNISANKIFSEQSPSHHYKCIGGNGLRGFTDIYNVEGHYAIIGRQGALCGCVNIADGRFYATEHAVIVDTFNLISPNFMFYYLTALNLNKYATATAQPGLSVSKVMEILSPLPPLKEQQRIVAQIEKLFEQLH